MRLRAVDEVVEDGRRLLLPVDGCGSFSRSSYLWVLSLVPMSDSRFIDLARGSLASKRKNIERIKIRRREKKKGNGKNVIIWK